MRRLGALLAGLLLLTSASFGHIRATDELAWRGDDDQAFELRTFLGFNNSRDTIAKAHWDVVTYPDMTWGMPMSPAEAAEMQRRIGIMEAMYPAVEQALTMPSWAGWWIDQPSGGTPVLQFADSSAKAMESLGASIPKGTPYRLVEVAHPLRDLEATKSAISDSFTKLRASGVPLTGVAIDVKRNIVQVELASLTEAAAASVTDAFGGAIEFVEEDSAESDTCEIEQSCLPLKGGIGFTNDAGQWGCTVGYLARRTDTSPDQLVYITAGHCLQRGADNEPFRHGSNDLGPAVRIGSVVAETFVTSGETDADVGVVRVSSSVPTNKNRVLRRISDETAYPFEVALSWDLHAVDMVVCRMGVTTHYECGPVLNRDADKHSIVDAYGYHWDALVRGVVVYSRDADGGDSGAPIFYTREGSYGTYAVLLGTHVHSQSGYVQDGGKGWYSPWDRGIITLEDERAPLDLTPCLSSTCGF